MIIVGIDPGLGNTGWGVIEKNNNKLSYIASGVIGSNAKDEISLRLSLIYNQLTLVLQKFKPETVAMEEVFVNMNSKSSLKLAYARGAAIAAVGCYGVELMEYAPNFIKKNLVGGGRAEKSQVKHMVKFLLPQVGICSDDESDALAAAICHSNFIKKLL